MPRTIFFGFPQTFLLRFGKNLSTPVPQGRDTWAAAHRKRGENMQFEIRNRWSGDVQITAEIDCAADALLAVKLGLAVKWAVTAKADLREADLRGADLRGANLSGANLGRADLGRANLRGANLRGANLSEADLSEADLRGANLGRANLGRADLTGADLTGGPVIEDIHAKVYAAASQPGALNMNMWHCGTSHCRAGWVVTLAGKEGADLEAKIGTPAAAMAIYMASDPERWKTERLPNFYCNNVTALADMARMAGVAA
jgi:uncharacterized protein YjbI with pentapeptide repeats